MGMERVVPCRSGPSACFTSMTSQFLLKSMTKDLKRLKGKDFILPLNTVIEWKS